MFYEGIRANFFPDITGPTKPTALTGTAGSNSISWSWNPSTDSESGVAYYIIRLNGVVLSITSSSPEIVTGPLSPGGSYTAEVAAVDLSNNQSAWSDPFTVSLGAPALRWYPGHYIFIDSLSTSIATQVAQIAAMRSETCIRGIVWRRRWFQLEGTTQGNYTQGFADLDQIVAECEDPAHVVKKKIWLMPEYVIFTGATTPPSNVVPAYVLNDSSLGVANMQTSVGWMANMWRTAVMDAWLAMHTAYGERYAGNNTFAGVQCGKETTQTVTSPGDYSQAAFASSYSREIAGLRTAWPELMVNAHTNFFASYEKGWFDQCITSRAGPGGPDVLPPDVTTGIPPYPNSNPKGKDHNVLGATDSDRIYLGNQGSPALDYRGVLPYFNQNQSPVYGGKEGCFLPAEIYDCAKNLFQQHYMFWVRGAYPTNSGLFDRTDMNYAAYQAAVAWSSGGNGILPFLRANPNTYTGAVPSALGATSTAGS